MNFHLNDKPIDLTQGLPDSRRQHFRPTICGPIGIMSQVFCANCGCDGGWITEEWAASVFYICDRCDEKYGKLTMPQIPDAVVRGEKNLVT